MTLSKELIFKFCAVFFLLLSQELLYAVSKSDALVVGVFPRRNAIETTKMFTPLVNYLSTSLNRAVVLETAKDFETFWRDVKNQKFDIVHYNQYHYVKTHRDYDYQVILKNIELGESTIAGSVIVRKDSGINSPQDLKGKSILFGGGRRAMMSYIVATYLLRQAGLKKDDYIENFAKNPPNAIIAAYYQQCAAAGAGDKILYLDVVSNVIDVDEMKFLLRSKQLPQLPWAVKGNMASSLKTKIQRLMAAMSGHAHGVALLKHAKLNGFAVAQDAEFDAHRKIIEEVLGEKY